MKVPTRSKLRGFTVVELMVAVVIISILAAIGMPQYNAIMQDSRRSEAATALNQLAMMLEQFHTENGTYTADLTDLGFSNANWNNTDTANYRFRVITPTAATGSCPVTTCFRLQIRPLSGSPQWGDPNRYELYSDGRRTTRQCPEDSCTSAAVNGWEHI